MAGPGRKINRRLLQEQGGRKNGKPLIRQRLSDLTPLARRGHPDNGRAVARKVRCIKRILRATPTSTSGWFCVTATRGRRDVVPAQLHVSAVCPTKLP